MRRKVDYGQAARDTLHSWGGESAQPQNIAATGAGEPPSTSETAGGIASPQQLGAIVDAPHELPGYDVAKPADAAIPSAGLGGKSKPGPAGGAQTEHALNLVEPTRAGTGTDGGSSGAQGGESPSTLPHVKASRDPETPLPTAPDIPARRSLGEGRRDSNRFTGGVRTNLGHFLGKVARNTGRPM